MKNPKPFDLVLDGITYSVALAAVPTPVNEKPESSFMLGRHVVDLREKALPGRQWDMARLIFGGSDAAGEKVNADVVFWYEARRAGTLAYIPFWACNLVAEFGAATYGSATNLGATGNLFADAITDGGHQGNIISTALSPGNTTDEIAMIEVPLRGASLLDIRVELDTAATADVFLQLSEMDQVFRIAEASADD